ncbi:hypothetical protein G9G53_22405 [Paenibacillus sp. EKM206P]|uniref:hypothetical protein n=1 Tax=Paenibacillus sp. EKM206P TaxID=1683674 RepID=UPI0013EAE991|nr:hypothetical protein [Paenibacillus sp. EKM206P]KAF6569047.1 hypothetical protein G9G53_22405 [Paenibacillus sp. EKM206P]
MTQQFKERIIQNFLDTKVATKTNTDAIKAFLQAGGSVESPEFQELQREREEAYFQWNNALLSLRVLPEDERLQVFGKMPPVI